jgi:23S rRNA (pseudouridine1915-N3)-methyltransferase
MRIQVIAVGRARRGAARDLYEDYAGRLAWKISLGEVEEKRKLPADALKASEGALLLGAVPKGAVVVALDAGGQALSSSALAKRLEGWRDNGTADLAFLIGGADGLGGSVLERADFRLSLGPMTWPHMLVRAMLAEQLYRAQSILTGHPYHRG